MDKFLITGGRALRGDVSVSSAKNSVLPLLAACLLTEEKCVIEAVPHLDDVTTMTQLLRSMGVKICRRGRALEVEASGKIEAEAPYDIVRRMRASYYVLGPLVARFGQAHVSLPGGCAIGARPVDLHIRGISALGAQVKLEHGYITARSSKTRLQGTSILLSGPRGPSVGATINTMMAAVLCKGETVLHDAAVEPEVVDVAGFLNAMGARITGAGTPTVHIRGVRQLSGARWRPIPDRIEAGTLAVAAAITRGAVEIRNCRPDHLTVPLETLRRAGTKVETARNSLFVSARDRPNSLSFSTAPYPGFPTDLQAQFMALACLADGTSVITENVFEARFLHAMELERMGAQIAVKGNVAVVQGVEHLSAAQVMASDLRASAALVLAGLSCRGKTELLRVYHLDRGYERLELKLNRLGAQVERVRE